VKATGSHLVNDPCVLAVAAVLSGGIKVGERAPDFTVTAHTKEKVSLSDFEGQKVILWFYPRASTGG
jgi:peroxiredoxin